MKILKVKIRVLAAWNNHGQELAMGLAEPGSKLTSALKRIELRVSKKTEAQMHT